MRKGIESVVVDQEEEERWIEDGDDDIDDENDENDQEYFGGDLFSNDVKTPQDTFTIALGGSGGGRGDIEGKDDNGTVVVVASPPPPSPPPLITLTLTGIKARYPHLLQSTGLTLWKGSENLCTFLGTTEQGRNLVRHKSVVELGAGLGLCGMIAHRVGAARVILTDGDTDTLANMRTNVASNRLSSTTTSTSTITTTILCKQLLWGKQVKAFRDKWYYSAARSPLDSEEPPTETMEKKNDSSSPTSNTPTTTTTTNDIALDGFDVVMGGDIAYAQESLEVLFETALDLLSSGSESAFLLSFVFRGGVTIQSVMECAERHHLECHGPCPLNDDDDDDDDDVDANVVDTKDGEGVYIFRRRLQ